MADSRLPNIFTMNTARCRREMGRPRIDWRKVISVAVAERKVEER
jgi:hypothetical protein